MGIDPKRPRCPSQEALRRPYGERTKVVEHPATYEAPYVNSKIGFFCGSPFIDESGIQWICLGLPIVRVATA